MAANPAVPSLLSLDVQKNPTETMIRVSGRVTSATSEQLQAKVRELIPDKKRIVLDLTGTSYVDSSGLGELVACATTLQNHEGVLRVCTATPHVQDLLRMTHMDTVLHLDQDEATSLREFAAQTKASAA